MATQDQSPFMRLIETQYEKLVDDYFGTVANKNLSREDNEDIFHDTIIKCNDKLNDKLNDNPMTDSDMKSYLFKSLKTNGIREESYARNKNREDEDRIPIDAEYNAYNDFTLDEIYEFVKKEYGDDMLDAFKKRLSGYTISELEKETNKKGLNYMINKILKRIREVFK